MLSLPFNGFVDKIIKPVIHANDIRVVHPANNTLKGSLVRNRPKQCCDERDAAAVYAIPCQTCPEVYYGESGRGLNIRMQEHERAVRGNYTHNACAKHANQPNARHAINWEGAHIVYKSNDWHSRLMVETSCIFARESFNRMKSTLGVDNFSANLILNSSPGIKIDPP